MVPQVEQTPKLPQLPPAQYAEDAVMKPDTPMVEPDQATITPMAAPSAPAPAIEVQDLVTGPLYTPSVSVPVPVTDTTVAPQTTQNINRSDEQNQ